MIPSITKKNLKKWIKITLGVIAGWSFWFILLLVSLKWINPPFTSFTLHENWEEVNAERYDLRNYWVSSDEIPKNIQWAVVASEDQRFWQHNGLDMVAINKAIEEREGGGRLRGASTISQQVAKNLFLSNDRSFIRKGVEAVITLGIETFWSKERIMEVYLNIAEFGPGVFGIGKASEYFFDKEASKITNDEAARMAVVLPNPKRMRVEPPTPFVNQRKDWVLRNMMQLSGVDYVPKPNRDIEPKVDYADSINITRVTYLEQQPMMWMPESDTSVYIADSVEFNWE
tara:strand:+ start:2895 stop:3752 length:858 start_codon:yes stop_codon:yes gene_type:complete